jgi:hypothetical protein
MKTRTLTPSLPTFSILTLCSLFGACASNPNIARELDDSHLEKKGEFQGATIGLNEKKEVVIEQQTSADSELRKLAAKAYDLEVSLNSAVEQLSRCREELADPRLGGSGKVIDIPELDSLKPASQVKEEFGITKEGNLSFVRKEMFMDRLQGERKYVDVLQEQLKLTEKHSKNCSREMRQARVKNGLPAERYSGQGHYDNGRYIQTRRAEQNLDDAFAIASEEKHQAGK